MNWLIALLLQAAVLSPDPRLLFPKPQDFDFIYAAKVDKDIVVTVTYGDPLPTRWCTTIYANDDEAMVSPLEPPHCVTPTDAPSDFDTWKDHDWKSMGRIVVSVTHGDKTLYYLLSTFSS